MDHLDFSKFLFHTDSGGGLDLQCLACGALSFEIGFEKSIDRIEGIQNIADAMKWAREHRRYRCPEHVIQMKVDKSTIKDTRI